MWNEIARAGTWTDMHGQVVNLTEADLDRLVANFDPAASPGAPLVLGHPKTDAPAYGWVRELKRQGAKLLARFRSVPEELKRAVAEERYRNFSVKVSGALDKLIHVGLLGAALPAITGLKPAALAEDPRAITIEFARKEEAVELAEAKVKIKELELAMQQRDKEALEKDKAIAEAQAKTKQIEDALATREKAFADAEATRVQQAREARFAQLVKDGKTTPAQKAEVMAFAAELGKAEATMSFAAPDGSVKQVSLEEKMWLGLESNKPNGLLKQFSAPEGGDAKPLDMTDIHKHV